MTDPAALTDEELDAIEADWPFISVQGPFIKRLIAALRASRAEVTEIRLVVEECLREPPPPKMSTLEAVRTMRRCVDAYRRNWGSCHERHMKAEAEVERLRQGLWDIYGILGFDLDGDKSPDVLVRPDLLDVVKEGASEVRAAMDEDDEAVNTRLQEKDREIARLTETVKGLRNATRGNLEDARRRVARADCDRSPCSCGMHRDRT